MSVFSIKSCSPKIGRKKIATKCNLEMNLPDKGIAVIVSEEPIHEYLPHRHVFFLCIQMLGSQLLEDM